VSDESISPRGADRLARAARAAQALSETLWEALHEELADPGALRVVELSQRLADVSATVALLARTDAGSPAAPEGPLSPASPAEPAAPRAPAARAVHEEAPPPPPPESPMSQASSAQRESPSSMAVLVDELAPRETPEIPLRESSEIPLREAPEIPLRESSEIPLREAPEIPLRDSSEIPLREAPEIPLRESSEIPLREAPEIAIRDERSEHAPSEWIVSIDRLLERYARDGAPFAVLLVELADVERLRHAELPGEVSRLTGLVEAALSGELRPADSLTRESPGRYWLLAPETDSSGARALVERLASAVRSAASHRGAPLELAIGIAVCPRDGSRAGALAAQAEIGLYAARASGRPVA
jgi:GGDEF domain-containing protein